MPAAWHSNRPCPRALRVWTPTKPVIACCSTHIDSGRRNRTTTECTNVDHGMDRRARRNAHHLFIHSTSLACVEDQTHQRHFPAHVHLFHGRGSTLARLRHPPCGVAHHHRQWHYARTGRSRIADETAFRLNRRFAGLQSHPWSAVIPTHDHAEENTCTQRTFRHVHPRNMRKLDGAPFLE